MPKTDKRVDAYIADAAAFAQPILRHVRAVVHEGCPDCAETLKWGMPTFMHGGVILCNFAAFKQHCSFRFWKGSLIVDDSGARVDETFGENGRITKLSDLPGKKAFVGYVKKAAMLNAEGTRVPKKRGKPKPVPPTPDFLAAALAKNKNAKAAFDAFPPSHKREYIEWLTEAKTDATRERRLAQAVQWIADGKQRNWKYT